MRRFLLLSGLVLTLATLTSPASAGNVCEVSNASTSAPKVTRIIGCISPGDTVWVALTPGMSLTKSVNPTSGRVTLNLWSASGQQLCRLDDHPANGCDNLDDTRDEITKRLSDSYDLTTGF